MENNNKENMGNPSGSKWFEEQISDGFVLRYERLPDDETSFKPAKGESAYQRYEVFETVSFGRVLLVDGLLQCSEFDEYVYHEVLVLGGGEGATLREVLKNPHVTNATMVDIDKKVVEACNELCPMFPDGAYEDPRVHLIYHCAKEVIETCTDGQWDVIICDLNDPLDEGPCWQLYTKEFYATALRKLAPDGILVTQAGCSSVWLAEDEKSQFSAIHNTLKQVFPPAQVIPYGAFLPSFTDEWGFQLCFKAPKNTSFLVDVELGRGIDECLAVLRLPQRLRWYDSTAHRKMFAIPKPVRALLNSDKTIIALDNPFYLTSYLENTQTPPKGILGRTGAPTSTSNGSVTSEGHEQDK